MVYGVIWITKRNETKYLVSRPPVSGNWSGDINEAMKLPDRPRAIFHVKGLRKHGYQNGEGGELFIVPLYVSAGNPITVPHDKPDVYWTLARERTDVGFTGRNDIMSHEALVVAALSHFNPKVDPTPFKSEESAKQQMIRMNAQLHKLMMEEDAYNLNPEYNDRPRRSAWLNDYNTHGWVKVVQPIKLV